MHRPMTLQLQITLQRENQTKVQKFFHSIQLYFSCKQVIYVQFWTNTFWTWKLICQSRIIDTKAFRKYSTFVKNIAMNLRLMYLQLTIYRETHKQHCQEQAKVKIVTHLSISIKSWHPGFHIIFPISRGTKVLCWHVKCSAARGTNVIKQDVWNAFLADFCLVTVIFQGPPLCQEEI